MDEGDIAWLDGIEIGGETAGDQALHHRRRCGLVLNTVGDGHQRSGRNGDLLCIAAGRVDPGHTLADVEEIDTLAHGQHAARAPDAQDLRIGHLVPRHALAHADVHEVDAGDGDLHQHHPAAGHSIRSRCVADFFSSRKIAAAVRSARPYSPTSKYSLISSSSEFDSADSEEDTNSSNSDSIVLIFGKCLLVTEFSNNSEWGHRRERLVVAVTSLCAPRYAHTSPSVLRSPRQIGHRKSRKRLLHRSTTQAMKPGLRVAHPLQKARALDFMSSRGPNEPEFRTA